MSAPLGSHCSSNNVNGHSCENADVPGAISAAVASFKMWGCRK